MVRSYSYNKERVGHKQERSRRRSAAGLPERTVSVGAECLDGADASMYGTRLGAQILGEHIANLLTMLGRMFRCIVT